MDEEKPSLLAAFDYYQILVLGPDRGSWVKCQCPIPGHEDTNPSASVNEEAGRWRKATEPVVENWLKTTKERGLDGQKLLDQARAAIKKHEGAA